MDIEGLADLLGGLALDHVGDGLTTDVEEGLDVEVVGGLAITALADRHIAMDCWNLRETGSDVRG